MMTYINCYNTRTGHVETIGEFPDVDDAKVRRDTLSRNDTSADHAYYVSATAIPTRELVSA